MKGGGGGGGGSRKGVLPADAVLNGDENDEGRGWRGWNQGNGEEKRRGGVIAVEHVLWKRAMVGKGDLSTLIFLCPLHTHSLAPG